MDLRDIGNIRLINQQVVSSGFKRVESLVYYMGAMQAQDYAMAKWAVGCRVPGCTDLDVEASISAAGVIRTHLMRPTWHLVSPEDIYWMLDLTAPQIKMLAKSRHRELGLSELILEKSYETIERALEGNRALSRSELNNELGKVGIGTEGQRSAHILFAAELEGVICSGPTISKQQTYALLKERVPKARQLSEDEALAELAKRYFSSHGPATAQDFNWWSGLSITKVKRALNLIQDSLTSATINGSTFWYSSSMQIPASFSESLRLLPAYDEFIISYKDRSACLQFEHQAKALSNNGIFRPTIVHNGMVTGIWSRSIKKDKVIITAGFFKAPNKKIKTQFEDAAAEFADFLQMKMEIRY